MELTRTNRSVAYPQVQLISRKTEMMVLCKQHMLGGEMCYSYSVLKV